MMQKYVHEEYRRERGSQARLGMYFCIEHLIDSNRKLDTTELSNLNKEYSEERQTAMICGTEISKFPRRLRINTRLPR
jgi:hypothetical protein